MRVAILADIHGNLPACEAVLEDIAREVSQQMGKPVVEARREVDTFLDRAQHMMSIAAEALALIPKRAHRAAFVVVGGIIVLLGAIANTGFGVFRFFRVLNKIQGDT